MASAACVCVKPWAASIASSVMVQFSFIVMMIALTAKASTAQKAVIVKTWAIMLRALHVHEHIAVTLGIATLGKCALPAHFSD